MVKNFLASSLHALVLIMILVPRFARAEAGVQDLFMMEKRFDFQASGLGLIGSMTSSVIEGRTSRQFERVIGALSFDLAAAAMQGITCKVGDACQATLIQAVDDATLRSKLAGASGTSLTLFQYLPLVSDNQFWARLRVFRVSLVQEKLESKEVARMVHVSMLPKSERDSGGAAWLSGSPSKLEEEVRLSFAELRGLWTRVNADAAANGGNAQKAWGSLPKVPAEMDGWIFHCGGMFGCSREHILNLGTSRVWISHPAGNKAVSLDRETAASAANVVNYDFPDSTP